MLKSRWRYHLLVVPELGRKYGDFVRVGPREVLIFDAGAVRDVSFFYSVLLHK